MRATRRAPGGVGGDAPARRGGVESARAPARPPPPLTSRAARARFSRHLTLSTNCIDRLIPLNGMKNLRILSIGRNQIKKIEKLDDVAETLEQLWISYNLITSLDGLQGLTNLTTLYMSNNNLKSFAELSKLASLPNLKDVVFLGNPMYEACEGGKEGARIEVLKQLPNLTKIDGSMITPSERDKAAGVEE